MAVPLNERSNGHHPAAPSLPRRTTPAYLPPLERRKPEGTSVITRVWRAIFRKTGEERQIELMEAERHVGERQWYAGETLRRAIANGMLADLATIEKLAQTADDYQGSPYEMVRQSAIEMANLGRDNIQTYGAQLTQSLATELHRLVNERTD